MIQFLGAFGSEAHTIRLSQPQGSGSNYQIVIGNFFKGQLVRVFDESGYRWKAYLASNDFTAADQQILEDIIKAHDPL